MSARLPPTRKGLNMIPSTTPAITFTRHPSRNFRKVYECRECPRIVHHPAKCLSKCIQQLYESSPRASPGTSQLFQPFKLFQPFNLFNLSTFSTLTHQLQVSRLRLGAIAFVDDVEVRSNRQLVANRVDSVFTDAFEDNVFVVVAVRFEHQDA